MPLRVLVADDEQDMLEAIQDRLEAFGINVTTAATGAQALNRIKTEKFDAAVLDVKMPEMTGLEVLENLRKSNNTLPVIIITSSISRDAAIGSLARGADEFVLKPFEWEELKLKLERVLKIAL